MGRADLLSGGRESEQTEGTERKQTTTAFPSFPSLLCLVHFDKEGV
jgi:hypothetical protein